MTVYLVGHKKIYVGLAADQKPKTTYPSSQASDAMPAGSEFWELDTGNRYIWYPAGSTWYEWENVLVSTS